MANSQTQFRSNNQRRQGTVSKGVVNLRGTVFNVRNSRFLNPDGEEIEHYKVILKGTNEDGGRRYVCGFRDPETGAVDPAVQKVIKGLHCGDKIIYTGHPVVNTGSDNELVLVTMIEKQKAQKAAKKADDGAQVSDDDLQF